MLEERIFPILEDERARFQGNEKYFIYKSLSCWLTPNVYPLNYVDIFRRYHVGSLILF